MTLGQNQPMRVQKKGVSFVLMGAVGAGKTSLSNALRGVDEPARKTQAVEFAADGSIDTPGEFFSHPRLYHALITTTVDAEILVYVHAADDMECRLPSGLLDVYGERRLIGVITKIDLPDANLPAVRKLLQDNGIQEIFEVSTVSKAGLEVLAEMLYPDGGEAR